MAGVTNAPFRAICRRYGAGLYVSEMVTARALVEGNPKTELIAAFAPGETPRSIQLYGVDPRVVGDAVGRLVDDGRVDHIDINFGCPAPKVTKLGGGAALPVRHRLAAAVLRSAVRAAGSVPVTVKFRLGIDEDHLTHIETGRIAQGEGCAAVALHARTAEQLYSGTARWAAIGELKERLEIPVFGNGDVWEAPDAMAMVAETGCDGVVIGRGCLGRPWLFRDLAEAFAGRPVPDPPSLGEIIDVMVEHFDLLAEWFDPHRATREFRKHAGWYLTGYPTGPTPRRELSQLSDRRQLLDVLARLDPTATMTDNARRARRGHTNGPRPVSLPDRWFELRDSDDGIDAAAGDAASGG
ncbi:MAG: tRNA dihydrouridine synthase DusB [Microthrixaceae bacterium]|nr:tRNA dihydrouridine synthase DusB [Microthrixaceae bacterium]